MCDVKKYKKISYDQKYFISKVKKLYGDKYSYDNVVYDGARNYIKIHCNIHNIDFEQRPETFYTKPSCPECLAENNSRIITNKKFIEKAKAKYGDRYDYKNTLYTVNKENIKIHCNIHNIDFEQRPMRFLSESPACYKCREEIKSYKALNNFLKKSKELFLDKYTYHTDTFSHKEKTISITCNIHGKTFTQNIYAHMRGVIKCDDCSIIDLNNKKKLSTENFIRKAKEKHGSRFDYSKVNYVDMKTPVTIICPIHGEFEQKPHNHYFNAGCKKCDSMGKSDRHRTTYEEFIKRAKDVHGDMYDYSLSEENYVNASSKIKILCKEHGVFIQKALIHMQGHGCNKCRYLKNTYTLDQFITKANVVHKNKYDYKMVTREMYNNTNDILNIICPMHGMFKQKARYHLEGRGCELCKRDKRFKKSEKYLIDKLKKRHDDTLLYDKVKYNGLYKEITVTCKKHGDFNITPALLLVRKTGCIKCHYDKTRITKDDFIKKAKKIHDNKYDYSKVVYDIYKETFEKKVDIICPDHGLFKQTIPAHLEGRGCYLCKESRGEKKISEWLKENNIKFLREYTPPGILIPYRYDFYLPELNILIEYDGEAHFIAVDYFGGDKTLKRTKERDKEKNNIAKALNIPLIRIKYDKYKVLGEYIKHKISRIYKFNIDGKYFKTFTELCNYFNLPDDTTLYNYIERIKMYKS